MTLLIAALLAAAPAAAPAPDNSDLRCFRLMADLSRADDPEVRRLGLTAAHFFLGRIDAAAPGFDVGTGRDAAVGDAERSALLRQCGDALSAAGFDADALSDAQPETFPST